MNINMLTLSLILAAAGYLIGSCNASILLSRRGDQDVRSCGSGNAGATNMARTYGWKVGLLTLSLDFMKGIGAAWLGSLVLKDIGLAVCGFACLLGHCYPLYFGFRGGKGISVGAALALAIDWRVLAVIAAVFLLGALPSRRVSLGSVLAALAVFGAALAFHVSAPKLTLAALGMLFVLFQQRANIKRLLNGTEPAFRAASHHKKGDPDK